MCNVRDLPTWKFYSQYNFTFSKNKIICLTNLAYITQASNSGGLIETLKLESLDLMMFRKSKLSFKIAELKNYSNWKCRQNGCSITRECFIFEVKNKPSRKQKSCKKENWIEKTDYLLTDNAEEKLRQHTSY